MVGAPPLEEQAELGVGVTVGGGKLGLLSDPPPPPQAAKLITSNK